MTPGKIRLLPTYYPARTDFGTFLSSLACALPRLHLIGFEQAEIESISEKPSS